MKHIERLVEERAKGRTKLDPFAKKAWETHIKKNHPETKNPLAFDYGEIGPAYDLFFTIKGKGGNLYANLSLENMESAAEEIERTISNWREWERGLVETGKCDEIFLIRQARNRLITESKGKTDPEYKKIKTAVDKFREEKTDAEVLGEITRLDASELQNLISSGQDGQEKIFR